jgi:hypothetical protein
MKRLSLTGPAGDIGRTVPVEWDLNVSELVFEPER